MTTSPAPVSVFGAVRPTNRGTLILQLDGVAPELTPAQAEEIATALREAVYACAPAMTRVRGYYADTDRTMRVIPDEEIPAYEAEGLVDLEHGLACPHPDCEAVAWRDHYEGVAVVDAHERWSSFGYCRELGPERIYNPKSRDWEATGRQTWHETVVGSYVDTDYQGIGYRCETCSRPVTLPADVEEEGN